ncbi:MAG: hypothetical protein ACI93T_004623, partial [Porticoccaceae bacterium]
MGTGQEECFLQSSVPIRVIRGFVSGDSDVVSTAVGQLCRRLWFEAAFQNAEGV